MIAELHEGHAPTICYNYCVLIFFVIPSGPVAVAFSRAFFGQGNGSIHMDDVGCLGSESNLTTCIHVGRDRENCGHSDDAGIRCEYILVTKVIWTWEKVDLHNAVINTKMGLDFVIARTQ